MKNFKLLMLFILTLVVFGMLSFAVSAENIEEIESNNTVLTATKISVGDTAMGMLSDDSDSDYYEFTVTEKGYMKVIFTHPKVTTYEAAWKLTVYKYTDTYEVIHTLSSGGDSTMTESPKIGVEPGVYYIEITNGGFYFRVGEVEYGVKMSVTSTENWESENNNDFRNADEIECGKEYGGYVSDRNDIDCFKTEITKEGYINLYFTYPVTNNGCWILKVHKYSDNKYDTIHTQKINAESSMAEIPRIGVTPGIYYIEIIDERAGYTYYIEYGLSAVFTESNYWEHESNGEYSTANNIYLGATYGGYILDENDIDYFKFTISQKGDLNITFTNPIAIDGEWTLTVYKCSDTYENVCEHTIYGDNTISTISVPATETGDYFLKIAGHSVYSWRVSNKEYGINLSLVTKQFSDVKPNHWYYDAVSFVVQKSYMKGMSDTTFSPNSNITREQFVLILANIAGVDTDEFKNTASGFTDVPTGQWYSGAVTWAVKEGYVSGMSADKFGRGQSIQRAALARMLYNYASKNGINVDGRADLSSFGDAKEFDKAGNAWMVEPVQWAVDAGIISGMEINGKLSVNPKGTATRAQAAVMLMKFDELLK